MDHLRDLQPHELRAYRALRIAGYDFAIRPVNKKARSSGHTTPDVFLEGKIWELKCPHGQNRQKTISRNINKAVRQMKDAMPPLTEYRVILSCLETALADEEILFQVDRVLQDSKENLVEVLVILKTGEIIRKCKTGA